MKYTSMAHQLGESLRIFAKKIGILERDEIQCCGISFSQYNAILEIGNAGEVSLIQLADMLVLDKSTLSKIVNNLVDGGLAEREIDPRDRRYVTIRLTESGVRIYNRTQANLDAYYEKIYESLPAEKRNQVLESIQILIEAVNGKMHCR